MRPGGSGFVMMLAKSRSGPRYSEPPYRWTVQLPVERFRTRRSVAVFGIYNGICQPGGRADQERKADSSAALALLGLLRNDKVCRGISFIRSKTT